MKSPKDQAPAAGKPYAATDSLAAAAAAGPPLDWDDQDQNPAAPSRTVAANEADPLHSIYGAPPTDGQGSERLALVE